MRFAYADVGESHPCRLLSRLVSSGCQTLHRPGTSRRSQPPVSRPNHCRWPATNRQSLARATERAKERFQSCGAASRGQDRKQPGRAPGPYWFSRQRVRSRLHGHGVGDRAADVIGALDDAALRDAAETAATFMTRAMGDRTMRPRANGGTEDGTGPAARRCLPPVADQVLAAVSVDRLRRRFPAGTPRLVESPHGRRRRHPCRGPGLQGRRGRPSLAPA